MTTLKVGFFAEDKYPDGTPVSEVAQIQEYGGINKEGVLIPERPFMRPCSEEKSDIWRLHFNSLIKKKGIGKIKECLEELSKLIEKDIKDSIDSVEEPELSKLTIKERQKRGNYSTKPLEDTKFMYDSVKGKIEE